MKTEPSAKEHYRWKKHEKLVQDVDSASLYYKKRFRTAECFKKLSLEDLRAIQELVTTRIRLKEFENED